MLINLLSNAIKYNCEQGKIEVTVHRQHTQTESASAFRTPAPGCSPETLAQLFQPFNRLGQEASAEEGTGIGLVVTKRLVELMGGVIGVESTVGAGSVFWFELMTTVESHGTIGDVDTQPSVTANVKDPTRERLLLYVEDNPANLRLVEQLIARRPDLRLMTAVTGSSASSSPARVSRK